MLDKNIQDVLLPHIENGKIILIGATTSNPYHSLNNAIRSRCHLIEVKPINNVSDTEIYKDCLTITTRGEYSGTVFYHDYSFVLANNILVMPMPNISKNAKLFLATDLQALPLGGYNNYPTKD